MNIQGIFRRCIVGVVLLLGVTACTAEVTPTPSMIDPTDFATYIHPTGVFSLSMPPDWVIRDISDARALNVELSPPGAADPALGIYIYSDVLPLPEAGTENTLNNPIYGELVDEYLAYFHAGDGGNFKEIERSLQADGSLRVVYLIDSPGETAQGNDFIELHDPFVVALRARLPEETAQFRTLTRVIDTFQLHPEAEWRSAAESIFGAARDAVGFASLNAWVDQNNGFVIVGQVVDNSDQALEFVRITAQLYDAQNQLLAEQDDFVSSDVVLPGEFTPFAIVFNDGLPPGTVRYDLNASARFVDFAGQSFYGSENFTVSSEADFNDSGFLEISGQVRNEGAQAASLVKVIVTVFDDAQRVIATDTTLVDIQRLGPSETSSFSVLFIELGGVPNTFLVTAQGVIEE